MTAQSDYAERLAALGLEPVANTPQEFTRFIQDELDKWSKVIRTAAVRAD